MDTITHGIAGALIGKAIFRGEDMFAAHPMSRGRVITWSLMLGAIFPDSDVFRDIFSRDPLLVITWHRSITHSLVMLPLWVLLLAAVTRAFANSRKWQAPSFAALTAVYAVGILSHILLDLVTSFGTMIWSPLAWSRPAWDLVFIVDFTLTAIFLIPQLLAWTNEDPQHQSMRAFIVWSVFALATVGVAALLNSVNVPTSAGAIVTIIALLAVLIRLPVIRGKGLRVRYATWNRAGF